MAEPTEKAAAYLVAIYQQLEKDLEQEIKDAASIGFTDVVRNLKERQARVQVLIIKAQQAAAPAIAALSSSAYQLGADFSIKQLRKIFSPTQVNAILSAQDRAAAQLLAENAVNQFQKVDQLIGRRVDDVLRQIALQETTISVASGEASQTLAERLSVALQRAGLTETDGVLHFVQINGRNYRLGPYTKMVSRTTVREAATEGMKNRLLQNEIDLVLIDDGAEDACEICQPYQGQTYSLSGQSEEYPQAVDLPPFHPNCRCVLTPAPIF